MFWVNLTPWFTFQMLCFYFHRSKCFYFAEVSLYLYGEPLKLMSLWRQLFKHVSMASFGEIMTKIATKLWRKLHKLERAYSLSSLVSQLALVSRLVSRLALVSRLGLVSPHRRNSRKWELLTFFWGRRGLALGDSATSLMSRQLSAGSDFRRASLLAATFFKHSSSSGTQAFWRRRDQLSDVEVRLLSVSRDVVVSDC